MQNHDSDDINLSKLELELKDAVESEQRYWRENDAKFRAVYQKVASYDEFRDIVAAAHLKPLDKQEKMTFSINQPWNRAAQRNSTEDGLDYEPQNETQSENDEFFVTPRNCNEFIRVWRKLNCESIRYKFLTFVGARSLGYIFRQEIPFGLLGDIIEALKDGQERDDTTVVEILEELSRTNRFDLSLQFMSLRERQLCRELFDDLVEHSESKDETVTSDVIIKLQKVYVCQ